LNYFGPAFAEILQRIDKKVSKPCLGKVKRHTY